MQKITPFLWFDDQAEEALHFYESVFKDSKILNIRRFGDEVPGPQGKVLTGVIELYGQEFMVLNGGPLFKFNEAISFYISCEDQAEVDYFWQKLGVEGGEPGNCGWLKDKFGVSWQVVPAVLDTLMGDADAVKAKRVTEAMLKMHKLDIAALQAAHDQA